MYRVIIAGGGWAGCAAAVTARNAGAKVILLEKTDLLLGLGNVGGIMRNNGRFTAAEENISMGADELFAVTDRCSRHTGLDFPGHRHASLYDVMKVEPEVRRLLREKGVDVRLMSRAVDVVADRSGDRTEIKKSCWLVVRRSRAMFSSILREAPGLWATVLHTATAAACVY